MPQPSPHLWAPGVAFCTAELKKASLKKSREPLKMTRALFLAWSPAMRRVFFPTACGYWQQNGAVSHAAPGRGQSRQALGQDSRRHPGRTLRSGRCARTHTATSLLFSDRKPTTGPRGRRAVKALTWVMGLSGKKE